MRLALILGRRHDGKHFEVVHGPEVAITEQQLKMKALLADRQHPHFERIQLWISDAGCIRDQKFSPPPPPAKKEKKKGNDH